MSNIDNVVYKKLIILYKEWFWTNSINGLFFEGNRCRDVGRLVDKTLTFIWVSCVSKYITRLMLVWLFVVVHVLVVIGWGPFLVCWLDRLIIGVSLRWVRARQRRQNPSFQGFFCALTSMASYWPKGSKGWVLKEGNMGYSIIRVGIWVLEFKELKDFEIVIIF